MLLHCELPLIDIVHVVMTVAVVTSIKAAVIYCHIR